jgi:predicted LPLAT superfamily acyltransferase
MRRLEIPQEGTSAQRAKALAVSYVSILETMARRYPEQWYNFFDFWAE